MRVARTDDEARLGRRRPAAEAQRVGRGAIAGCARAARTSARSSSSTRAPSRRQPERQRGVRGREDGERRVDDDGRVIHAVEHLAHAVGDRDEVSSARGPGRAATTTMTARHRAPMTHPERGGRAARAASCPWLQRRGARMPRPAAIATSARRAGLLFTRAAPSVNLRWRQSPGSRCPCDALAADHERCSQCAKSSTSHSRTCRTVSSRSPSSSPSPSTRPRGRSARATSRSPKRSSRTTPIIDEKADRPRRARDRDPRPPAAGRPRPAHRRERAAHQRIARAHGRHRRAHRPARPHSASPSAPIPKGLKSTFTQMGELDVDVARKLTELLRTQDLALAEEIRNDDDDHRRAARQRLREGARRQLAGRGGRHGRRDARQPLPRALRRPRRRRSRRRSSTSRPATGSPTPTRVDAAVAAQRRDEERGCRRGHPLASRRCGLLFLALGRDGGGAGGGGLGVEVLARAERRRGPRRAGRRAGCRWGC